ncbi:hypothetical protein [Mucilaginibacter sp. 22184]|uniref:hypothetical protein n=1 Tax=Mucilaginibacter sp. 22184 TaxID=3453887 RepID=UPI003F846CD5
MFQKICIKSKERDNQKIDISFLVDSMLFYGKIVVLAHKEELITLLNYFGEEFLKELIISGRLDLRIRENILGSMLFPDDKYNIDLFSGKDKSYSAILYEAHREVIRNSVKNQKFSDDLSKITQPFVYTGDITEQIRADFENVNLLKKLLPIYIHSRLPEFQLPNELQIEITKDSSFGPFDAYSLNSNIDIADFNSLSKQLKGENHFDFNYSGFLLALSESKGDIFIASHFESELVTTKLYSAFIGQQLEDLIQRRLKSQENLNLFDEYVLADCHTIGDAFVNGLVSKKDLLDLLEKADKFRDWLLKVPDDKNLIGEYHKEVTRETFADKLPTKATRFVIFEGIGVALDLAGAGGIGTAIATGLSAVDNFFLDKLIAGWKPNQFIDNNLKPMIKKQ